MSLGYAEKLKPQEDYGGTLGTPELSETPENLQKKIDQLSALVKDSNYIVAFTGAGISTACGIPDFRGPNGVWTCEKSGRPRPKAKCSFVSAKPSLTHQVLVALRQSGKLKYTISQNVDGLHLRSGIPRTQLAELHGNTFAERCPKCKKEYIRDFEIETVGFKQTGRSCSVLGCTGRLKDNILDWDSALPEDEFEESKKHLGAADVVICLGTSLQINPAAELPLLVQKGKRKGNPGKVVIVNLQKTPLDKSADIRIFARVDEVMSAVASNLNLAIPNYMRKDAVLIGHCQQRPRPKKKSGAQQRRNGEGAGAVGSTARFEVFVESIHGPKCPVPAIESVEITVKGQTSTFTERPYRCGDEASVPCEETAEIVIVLTAAADEGKRTVRSHYSYSLLDVEGFDAEMDERREKGQTMPLRKPTLCWNERLEFVTQEQKFPTRNGIVKSSRKRKLESA